MRKRTTAFILILLISTLVLPSIATAFVADPPASDRSSLVNKKVKLSPRGSEADPIRTDNHNLKIAGVWDILAQDIPGGNYQKIGTDLVIKQIFYAKKGKQGTPSLGYNFIRRSQGMKWANELILKQSEYNFPYKKKNGISESCGNNTKFVSENMGNLVVNLRYSNISEDRMYLRSFAELCGSHIVHYEADYNEQARNWERWGASGRVWLNKFKMPSANVSMPSTGGTKNGLPVLYTDTDYEISVHGYTDVTFTESTMRALGLNQSQFIKMSYKLSDESGADYGIGMSTWGNWEHTNHMMEKLNIGKEQLSPGKYVIHVWVKDYADRWIRYSQWFYMEDRKQEEEEGYSDKKGNIDADFDIDVYEPGGKLVPNFNVPKAKTGDIIRTENRSRDSNWMYTKVYDEERERVYRVAVRPAPEREERVIKYNVQKREDPEYAKMYKPSWFLPRAYTSRRPYKEQNKIFFKAINVNRSDNGRTYFYGIRPYRYEDHGHYKEYTSSRWKHEKEGGYTKVYTDHRIWSSKTVWNRYNNSQTVRYGRIKPSKYIHKQYVDDKWEMESYPHYVMQIAMTITDYYTKTPTPYIETNYGYCSKPVKVFHNNKPVAYFTVPSAVSARRDPIHIAHFSYDVDDDPIVQQVWEIVETGATFSSASATENYINNVLVDHPGKYTIRLKVLDDPRDRYERLEPRWSEPFERVIEIKGEDPNYVSYKANIIFDREYVYTQWHKNAELNVIVNVQDIGYWTKEVLTDGGITWRFRPLRLEEVKEPFHLIVRYNDRKMSVIPEQWEVVSTGYNNFEITAKFKYPKGGRPSSELVIPFEAEWAGLVSTLRWNVPVNAFNPSFFSDIEQKDITKFYPIPGLEGKRLRVTIDRQIKE